MSFLFRRRRASSLDKRLKRVASELSTLKSTIRTATREAQAAAADPLRQRGTGLGFSHGGAGNTGRSGKEQGELFDAAHTAGSLDHGWRSSDRVKDDRFVTYLATGSFQSGHTLREERRIQRNKAVLMVTFVFLVLAALLYRLLFW